MSTGTRPVCAPCTVPGGKPVHGVVLTMTVACDREGRSNPHLRSPVSPSTVSWRADRGAPGGVTLKNRTVLVWLGPTSQTIASFLPQRADVKIVGAAVRHRDRVGTYRAGAARRTGVDQPIRHHHPAPVDDSLPAHRAQHHRLWVRQPQRGQTCPLPDRVPDPRVLQDVGRAWPTGSRRWPTRRSSGPGAVGPTSARTGCQPPGSWVTTSSRRWPATPWPRPPPGALRDPSARRLPRRR